jgi:hypothetical protein
MLFILAERIKIKINQLTFSFQKLQLVLNTSSIFIKRGSVTCI